jgi:hypothetical protein
MGISQITLGEVAMKAIVVAMAVPGTLAEPNPVVRNLVEVESSATRVLVQVDEAPAVLAQVVGEGVAAAVVDSVVGVPQRRVDAVAPDLKTSFVVDNIGRLRRHDSCAGLLFK